MKEIATIKTDIALIKQQNQTQTLSMQQMRVDNKEFKDLLLDPDKGLLCKQDERMEGQSGRIGRLEKFKDKVRGGLVVLSVIASGGTAVFFIRLAIMK